MEEHPQRQINEAAHEFADALVQSFRATADRTVGAQEQGAQLTQDFFNRVIENLRTQAENTQQIGQQLADQQQRAAKVGRALTQESVDAYMNYINSMFNSMFSDWQEPAAQRFEEPATQRAKIKPAEEKPWPHYPLFDSGDPTFAQRVDEELEAGFGER